MLIGQLSSHDGLNTIDAAGTMYRKLAGQSVDIRNKLPAAHRNSSAGGSRWREFFPYTIESIQVHRQHPKFTRGPDFQVAVAVSIL